MCARAGKHLGALEKSLCVWDNEVGKKLQFACLHEQNTGLLVQVLSVLCTEKNLVILPKTPPLWGDWRLPSLATNLSSQVMFSWLCSHTQAISTQQAGVGFRIFCQSALVLSLQGLFSTFHYSLMNAATHHLPEQQNCWSVTWLYYLQTKVLTNHKA